LSGRTSGNTVVNFAGAPEWIGRLVPVRITAANPNSLKGEAVGVA
jgi:tRNA-2-methylthio-N6-dimethylallyladenosine synthase